ncbi:hypothetical protein JTB14_011147 [Gonioctena quinquepunctata]|nr:hypothetical protein JTB14_011147 [Gonioctena quinquepunctata]
MAEEIAEARIAASLKEVFENNRSGHAEPSSLGRRRKLQVVSGRSITADDIVTEHRLEMGNISKKMKTLHIFPIVSDTSVVKPMRKPEVLRRGQLEFKTV